MEYAYRASYDGQGKVFVDHVVALLLTIPRPVTGTILMVVMGLLFVEGVRTFLQHGFNQQKAVIVGFSLSIGIGLQGQNIVTDALGIPWGVAFGNSIVVGVLAAALMSVVLDMTVSRRRRIEAELDMAALPAIDSFLREFGGMVGWDQAVTDRQCAAGEETLSSMLQLRDHYEENQTPRLQSSRVIPPGRWKWSFWRYPPSKTLKTGSPTRASRPRRPTGAKFLSACWPLRVFRAPQEISRY